jgi:hypothetical protein
VFARASKNSGPAFLKSESDGLLASASSSFYVQSTMFKEIWQFGQLATVPLFCCSVLSAEMLFVATPLTEPHSFTSGIEGPACDKEGNIYAVSFARTPTMAT